jgi:hypothetical protein
LAPKSLTETASPSLSSSVRAAAPAAAARKGRLAMLAPARAVAGGRGEEELVLGLESAGGG